MFSVGVCLVGYVFHGGVEGTFGECVVRYEEEGSGMESSGVCDVAVAVVSCACFVDEERIHDRWGMVLVAVGRDAEWIGERWKRMR